LGTDVFLSFFPVKGEGVKASGTHFELRYPLSYPQPLLYSVHYGQKKGNMAAQYLSLGTDYWRNIQMAYNKELQHFLWQYRLQFLNKSKKSLMLINFTKNVSEISAKNPNNFAVLQKTKHLVTQVDIRTVELPFKFASRTKFLYLKSRNFLSGGYVNFKQKIKLHCSFQMRMKPYTLGFKIIYF
jgi:hypothetical protein